MPRTWQRSCYSSTSTPFTRCRPIFSEQGGAPGQQRPLLATIATRRVPLSRGPALSQPREGRLTQRFKFSKVVFLPTLRIVWDVLKRKNLKVSKTA